MSLTVMEVSSVPLFLVLESKRTFLPRLSQSWYTISLIWLGSSCGRGQLNGRMYRKEKREIVEMEIRSERELEDGRWERENNDVRLHNV